VKNEKLTTLKTNTQITNIPIFLFLKKNILFVFWIGIGLKMEQYLLEK